MVNNLPIPDPLLHAHGARVEAHIAEEIRKHGPIPFARYMSLALYAPGLGYYSAGLRKVGTGGDFVTAPELSPLFSRCVAKQCLQVLADLPSGDILELGAGTGAMALSLLQELETHGVLPEHYFILEVSADFRERQQQLFQEKASRFLDRVRWLDRLPEQPIQGVIIGNEVVDAMPVHKFKIESGIKEFYVDYRDGKFVWELSEPSSSELVAKIKEWEVQFPENYESEINLWVQPWIASLSDALQKGLILLIDYGFPRHEYYHADRNQGTLMCHYQHRAHSDPLILTGLQDITAHVDFSNVAEAAAHQGLSVAGYTHQAAFLLNCGLLDFIQKSENPADHYRVAQEIKRLTLPSEMGELFKVIALTRGVDRDLIGFSSMNQVERLSCPV